MTQMRNGFVAAFAVVLAAFPVHAAVLGGGLSRTDCWAAFDNIDANVGKRTVTCIDGDPNCDADGATNGVCRFRLRACVNVPGIPRCSPTTIRKLRVRAFPKTAHPRPRFRPRLPRSEEACGRLTTIRVPLHGTKPGHVTLQMTAITADGQRDDDVLVLRCLPPPPICEECICPGNPAGGPDQLDLSTTGTGSDLDVGWTGISHNFPVAPRAQVRLCLTACDASTNPLCDVSTTPVGTGTINPMFGPPLPLIAQGVPVCLVNRYEGPPTGIVNVQTGEVTNANPLAIDLFSDVHLTLNAQVCPRCTSGGGTPSFGQTGTCDGGPNLGKACTVDSVLQVTQAQGNKTYALSGGCPPDPGQLAGTLSIQLRLTTGTSTLAGPTPCTEGQDNPVAAPLMDDSCGDGTCTRGACTGSACVSHAPDGTCLDAKGGLSQACCSTQTNLPCFATKNGGSITRTGEADPPTPAWPDSTYPKMSSGSSLVATFCAGATEKAVINNTSGLPGPGALILPVTETLTRSSP